MSQSDDASGLKGLQLPAESPVKNLFETESSVQDLFESTSPAQDFFETDPPAPDIFDRALTDILGKSNPQAYATISVIQRLLAQYRLTSHTEAYEVLHEAYLRGKKKLKTGEEIHNAHAWLKATAFHIISERKRKKRAGLKEPHVLAETMPDHRENLLQQHIISEELELLYQALTILESEEPQTTQMLYLKTVEGWPWSRVREWLYSQGEAVSNEAVLRQRASRAKKRLREIFFQLIDPG
jgi:DNA-directed RNA polymerase specialized sigma24 family protein